MSDGDESAASSVLDSVLHNLKNLPASYESHVLPRSDIRLFSREKSVHELLGGGRVADVLLWRHKQLSAGILTGATAIWILFEWFGCHLVSVLSLFLLIALAVLFVWSNAAAFLHRSPPPLPNVHMSEELVVHVASELQEEINKVLAIFRDIAQGKDFKLFSKVGISLWLTSAIGGWFHFLSLLYLGIVIALTVPVIYEKHEDKIDKSARLALEKMRKLYAKFDAKVLSKIPRGPTKAKKTE